MPVAQLKVGLIWTRYICQKVCCEKLNMWCEYGNMLQRYPNVLMTYLIVLYLSIEG